MEKLEYIFSMRGKPYCYYFQPVQNDSYEYNATIFYLVFVFISLSKKRNSKTVTVRGVSLT